MFVAFVWSAQMALKRLIEKMEVNKTRFDFRFKSGEWKRVDEIPGLIRALHAECKNWCRNMHVALDDPWMYDLGPYDGCFYVASRDVLVIKEFHIFLQAHSGIEIVRESGGKERHRV